MIKSRTPLSMVEVEGLLKESKTENEELSNFIHRFNKMKEKDAEQMMEELESLNLIKLRREEMVKIVDVVPEDVSDLNKIFVDTSLDSDEQNKILDVIKKYK